MAPTTDLVEIRNETSLAISLNTVRTVQPLEVLKYEPPGKLSVEPVGAGGYISFYPNAPSPKFNALPPILTIDVAFLPRTQDPGYGTTVQQFCNELPALKERGTNELRVTNETNQVAEVHLLGQTGSRLMGRIGPGDSWQHPAKPFLFWHFRTPSGLPLGDWFHPNPHLNPDQKPPFHVKLTEEFLEKWQAYQQRPALSEGRRGTAPLRLIGERRKSTPGPDDQRFISASTVRLDVSTEIRDGKTVGQPFNGLNGREVRDVEIAGPLLRWSGSNRILSGYYGKSSAADIRSLTIYCDRMEVADHLEFPRTNVTIHARELVFTGIGRIDTTPLPYPGRARSEYLTKDADDPTLANVPADADGDPTYQAVDGRKGEPGGNVTVHAREVRYVEDPSNKSPWIRFICQGGKGQQGEAGGLKAYVPGEGQPKKYGLLPPVTADDVARAFKDSFKLECSHFSWPGKVDWPNQISPNPWKQHNVVEVSVFAYSASLWLRYLHLPSHTHASGATGDVYRRINRYPPHLGELARHSFLEALAAPKRCDPRYAYPGGWPGEGGDGGSCKLITEKSASMIAALCDAGAMGDATLPVKADRADKDNPVHLWLVAYDKEIGRESTPNMGTLSAAMLAPPVEHGRAGAPPPQELTKDKYQTWGDSGGGRNSYVIDLEDRLFWTRPNGGRRGDYEQIVRSDLSWAQPAAMAAVLSYARTAFRNGFREEAARALAPYYAVTVLQADAVAQCSAEVRMAFGTMVALYNNLALDVDYYGNPPGWVPRLNALSNLAVLKSVREAAYGTYYFADRMLRDAEALEDLRETAVQATEVLKTEMSAAKDQLQQAYDALPDAMGKLNQAQTRVVGVQEEIVNLRKAAIARSVDQVMVQRFVSAALQLVDGVAKSLPIGQPFVGLAGSVFGAAAKIDWTAEKPLETGSAAITHLSEQVNTFVTGKQDAVANAVTGKLRGKATATEALITKLTREQEDATREPAEAVKAVEVTWQDFKSAELDRVDEQIKRTNDAIQTIKDAAKDYEDPAGQTASAFLTALNNQRQLLTRKQLAPLQKELVEYRRLRLQEITAARGLAASKNADLKAQADEAPKTDLPPTIKEKLAAATRQSAAQKARITTMEETANKTMAGLADLGTGLASVGNAIISMATPLTDEDPTVQRLANQLLVNDPVLRAAGEGLAKKLRELMAEKKQAAAELLRWQQEATTSLATVLRNLATMSQLSRQRQSIDMGLNPAAKAYLKETRDAAKDALAESIYWFVKSYQYEQLDDVEDSFFNFDSWADALLKQENTKLIQAAPPAEAPTGQGALVTRAPRILLSKEDFDKIGEAVFKAEQLKLGKALLEKRQKHGPKPEGEYTACVLKRTEQPGDAWERRQNEMLDALGREGEVAFDFVRDFGKGSYGWNGARVAQVKLVKLDIETDDPTLSLTFRVQQHGEMVIADKVDGDRRFYLFRAGRHDDPLGWTFIYNHRDRKTNSGIKIPPVPDPLGNVAKEMLNTALTFEEYQPALFSDYVIRITDLFGADRVRKGLKTIKELEMTVSLSAVPV